MAHNQIYVIMKLKSTYNSIVTLVVVCVAMFGVHDAHAQYGNGPKLQSADPANGTKVESLSEIILTMDQETADAVNDWGMESVDLPSVFGASSEIKAVLWYPVDDLTKLRITVTPAITETGTYEITVPAGYITQKDWESSDSENNLEFKLVYTIGSGDPGGDSVQYDVNYTSIEPGPGTYDSLDVITLTFDTEVFPDPDARASLFKDNMLYKTVRMQAREGDKIDLLLNNFDLQGTYELVIDKAQIGDAVWLDRHHLGHANPEFRIPGYRIKEIVSKLTYDFVPVVSPDGGEPLESLDGITLKFDGTWCAASQEQILLYDSNDNTYPMTLSMGGSLDEAVLRTAAPVTEAGTYRLFIPKGRFGNSDFEESAGGEGALNPELTVEFEVRPTGAAAEMQAEGIAIAADGDALRLKGCGRASVYTLQGIVRAVADVDGEAEIRLQSGVYIVNTGAETLKINIK